MFAALLFASALTLGTAAAQPAPFNQAAVTMGGKLTMPGGAPLIMFPGLYINLALGNASGEGGTQGTVVNHVGFIVDNVQQRVAQWKAAGVKVLPGGNGRVDQAYVETPDG